MVGYSNRNDGINSIRLALIISIIRTIDISLATKISLQYLFNNPQNFSTKTSKDLTEKKKTNKG